jgi:predicted ArsR family transcriptional regulator
MKKPLIKIDRDQIRALSNPRRLEIHTSLRTDGPATAKELAARLGVDEMGLYYHLRLLAAKNLITTESREASTKPETLYSVSARFLVADFDLTQDANLNELCRNVDSLARASSKEFRLAAAEMQNDLHDHSMIGRLAVRMSDKKFKKLTKRLRELREWLDDPEDSEGSRYSVSFFAIPIVPKQEAPIIPNPKSKS